MQSFEVEHIIPRERGGTHALTNLASSCRGCNGHKAKRIAARDTKTKKIVPLFHPRQQRWSEHFAWSTDFTLIVGRTPTGRATVAALQLNREGLVNLRRKLIPAGEHPPPEVAQE